MGHGPTWCLVLTAFTVSIGSSFLIGYNFAVVNLPAPYIEGFLASTVLHLEKNQSATGFVDTEFLYAQVSTIYIVAGVVGALSSGWIAEHMGRRNGLLFNHTFAFLGGLLCAFCVHTNQAALLFVGRFFLGLNCGITTGVAPMYLTEIAPREFRGAVGACNHFGMTVGNMIAYLVTLTAALNTSTLWPIACGLCIVPAAISLLILPFCPESPRFLFTGRSDEAGARKAFKCFNSEEVVGTLIEELWEEVQHTAGQSKFKFVHLFTRRDLCMPVLIACLAVLSQQMCGVHAIITYSATILKTTGIADPYIEYCTLAVGLLNLLGTMIALLLLEHLGRRTLLLWPTVVLTIALLLMTITVNVAADTTSTSLQHPMGIASAALILVYVCGFALGLGPVPALLVSELFRQGPRAAAYSLSQCIMWLSNLIILSTYPSVVKAIKGYSFLPFLLVVVACWIFFFLYLPETRNRTFDDIACALAQKRMVITSHNRKLHDLRENELIQNVQKNVSSDITLAEQTSSHSMEKLSL